MDKLEIVSIERTCYACPSQWDAKTKDGRNVYIRYRWGKLSVSVGEPGDDEEMSGVNGDCVFAGAIGDSYDGMLEYKDLKAILDTAGIATLPESSTGDEPTYEEASELFAKTSESLNKMIADGTVKVLESPKDLEEDATFVTMDKESKEAHERHGHKVVDDITKVVEVTDG